MNFFLRVLSLVFIYFAVRYWLSAIGFFDAGFRFDTMPNHWKVAIAFFSVSYPVAALGVWGLFRWGIVVWFLTAAAELGMYLIFTDLYGEYFSLVVFHLTSMGTWLLYCFIEFLDKKRALVSNNR